MSQVKAIAMGASAGALDALSAILPHLPKDFALPVFLVVHLPPDKDSVLGELLQHKCQLTVREAEDKAPIEPGTVYIAPPDYHLLIEKDYTLSLSVEEPVQFSRPSIDVLFETAADCYRGGLIGVVLSGANDDGTTGLKAILANGGTGLVQNPQMAYARAMPEAALQACPQAKSLSLIQIAEHLCAAGEAA